MSYTDIKNLPSTVVSLSRSIGEGKIRDQSFSVARTSNRVKVSLVDTQLLRVATPSGNMAKAASYKRQNYQAPHDMLTKLDRKLNELGKKLIKALRQGKDTTVLDALILRCQYYRHTNQVRLNELTEKAIEREETKAALMLPSDQVPVFERPIMPASVGRVHKVGRKVLKDRLIKHGEASEKETLACGLIVSRTVRTNGAHGSKHKGTDKAAALRRELKRLAKSREAVQ